MWLEFRGVQVYEALVVYPGLSGVCVLNHLLIIEDRHMRSFREIGGHLLLLMNPEGLLSHSQVRTTLIHLLKSFRKQLYQLTNCDKPYKS